MTFETRNARYREDVAENFATNAFLVDLGVAFVDCGPGWAASRLPIVPRFLQHTGVVHAGVVSTIADHTAGAAAITLAAADETVVTVEFKIHLLRAATGRLLDGRGDVLKAGARFSIVESVVHATSDDGTRTLVAKMIATMAVTARAG